MVMTPCSGLSNWIGSGNRNTAKNLRVRPKPLDLPQRMRRNVNGTENVNKKNAQKKQNKKVELSKHT